MSPTLRGLRRALDAFHRPAAARVLRKFSPIAGPQFHDAFNLAGHWTAWHALADTPSSLYGVDRCLRIHETVDPYHSRVFHMAVFGRSIARVDTAIAPWHDPRFHALQRETLDQFLSMVDAFGIDRSRLLASCFAGTTIGRHPDGSDRRLRQSLRLPADRASLDTLRHHGVRAVPVPAIGSLFIQPTEISLLGPRLEFFCDDLEFATIVFANSRIRRGTLEPCHYSGAYAVGMERMLSVLTQRDFLHAVPRYARARRILERRLADTGSPALRQEVSHVLFGLEALAAVPERLSLRHRALVRRLKAELKPYILKLGITYREIVALFEFFQSHADL